MSHMGGWALLRSMGKDADGVRNTRLRPGTWRRVLGYGRPYRARLAVFLVIVGLGALLVVASPLILKAIIDHGVAGQNVPLVIWLAVAAAGVTLFDAALSVVQRWLSSSVGEGLIYDLRREVFGHVLRQPIGFFTRTQTGALVTRLNSDVIGAQQAFTSVMSNVVSNVVSVVVIVVTMAALSWQITLAALALLPLFLIPSRWIGRRIAVATRGQMVENAELGARMTERFNVAGALLVKLFGHPEAEDREYADRAATVRDYGITIALQRSLFLVGLTTLAALAGVLTYGIGGVLAIRGSMTIGTLLALSALLGRLYAPLTQLSTVRVDVLTALVSFERVFEILDLPPLVEEVENPTPLPPGQLGIEFRDVTFSYPTADQVSLESLETVSTTDRGGGGPVLNEMSFTVAPGEMVALVGPSGAGKSTTISLISRLYDPTSGTVAIGNGSGGTEIMVDLRRAPLADVRDRIGVVTQEAHMFHDTIRGNLLYAKPEATDADMVAALRAAQVWGLVERLPHGLDTVVGDRGHRLSGGEKQRLAIARLLLKQPDIVVLDEATAHLDSESEVAVQRALETALHGRTSVVIAHRLSTIRNADTILVIDGGRVVQSGRHTDLLAEGGLYADLYRTQFAESSPD